ncbi:hypothetical protein HJG60_011062 [Phyllostomus discolor]|uniref:Uncharacterized protein n=1 Tax=Phyllostomus discolor TaxID=89673 RepID=A0A834EAG6_9CHIR|nr:hypothetical protein HJG60_011062 [Phyllostomus discolor]
MGPGEEPAGSSVGEASRPRAFSVGSPRQGLGRGPGTAELEGRGQYRGCPVQAPHLHAVAPKGEALEQTQGPVHCSLPLRLCSAGVQALLLAPRAGPQLQKRPLGRERMHCLAPSLLWRLLQCQAGRGVTRGTSWPQGSKAQDCSPARPALLCLPGPICHEVAS